MVPCVFQVPVQVQMQQVVDESGMEPTMEATGVTTNTIIEGEIPAPTTVVALPEKGGRKPRTKSKQHRFVFIIELRR